MACWTSNHFCCMKKISRIAHGFPATFFWHQNVSWGFFDFANVRWGWREEGSKTILHQSNCGRVDGYCGRVWGQSWFWILMVLYKLNDFLRSIYINSKTRETLVYGGTLFGEFCVFLFGCFFPCLFAFLFSCFSALPCFCLRASLLLCFSTVLLLCFLFFCFSSFPCNSARLQILQKT